MNKIDIWGKPEGLIKNHWKSKMVFSNYQSAKLWLLVVDCVEKMESDCDAFWRRFSQAVVGAAHHRVVEQKGGHTDLLTYNNIVTHNHKQLPMV